MTDKSNTQDTKEKSRRRSRYDHPSGALSWSVLLFGVAVGLVISLYYAWIVQPIREVSVAPWQLETIRDTTHLLPDQDAYLIGIMLAHNYENDLAKTIERMSALRLPSEDTLQYVADLACRLVRGGYVDSNSRHTTVRILMQFYQLQGRAGCADQLILTEGRPLPTPTVVTLPTSTLVPPATKTVSPFETVTAPIEQITAIPITNTPSVSRSFTIVSFESFCSANSAGIIEVRVRSRNTGEELPAMPLRVTSDGVSSLFYTGLKPERGLGYADYQMDRGRSYVIEMPELSTPSTREIRAQDCVDEITNTTILRSYRIIFAGN